MAGRSRQLDLFRALAKPEPRKATESAVLRQAQDKKVSDNREPAERSETATEFAFRRRLEAKRLRDMNKVFKDQESRLRAMYGPLDKD